MGGGLERPPNVLFGLDPPSQRLLRQSHLRLRHRAPCLPIGAGEMCEGLLVAVGPTEFDPSAHPRFVASQLCGSRRRAEEETQDDGQTHEGDLLEDGGGVGTREIGGPAHRDGRGRRRRGQSCDRNG